MGRKATTKACPVPMVSEPRRSQQRNGSLCGRDHLPTDKLAIHSILLISAGKRDPATNHRTNDVNQPCQPSLLHGNIHRARAGTLQQLLIGLGRLVKQLHEERACLLVFTTSNCRQLVQLLLDQTCIFQRIFQSISTPKGRKKAALLKYTYWSHHRSSSLPSSFSHCFQE